MVELKVYGDEDTATAKIKTLYRIKMQYKSDKIHDKYAQANLYVNRKLAVIFLRCCDFTVSHGIKAFIEE